MLQVMNHGLTVAPTWSEHENEVGLVGLPLRADTQVVNISINFW